MICARTLRIHLYRINSKTGALLVEGARYSRQFRAIAEQLAEELDETVCLITIDDIKPIL